MYALEFETVIKEKYIELENVDSLMNKKVRIILLVEDDQNMSDVASQRHVKSDVNFFQTLSDRKIEIGHDIDIEHVMKEMNNGLC